MLTFLTAVHVLVAILLILFVLLQDSKGGAMGMLGGGGGGGGSNVFGSTGTVNVLVKITRWLAIGFAMTCIGLTIMISGSKKASVLDDALPAAPPQAPMEKTNGAGGATTDESAPASSTEKSQETKATPATDGKEESQ